MALLHDIIEDKPWSAEDLIFYGFSPRVVVAVEAMSKAEGERYKSYVERISENPLSIEVKLSDLTDNLDIKRLDKVKESDIYRINKYIKAYKFLLEIKKSKEGGEHDEKFLSKGSKRIQHYSSA